MNVDCKFFTPPWLAYYTAKRALKPLIDKLSDDELANLVISDFAAGNGAMIDGSIRYISERTNLSTDVIESMHYANDIDNGNITYMQSKYNNVNISHGCLTDFDISSDVFLINPPWIRLCVIARSDPGLYKKIKSNKQINGNSMEVAAYCLAMGLLKDGGRIGAIVPRSSFFTNKDAKNIRIKLFNEWGLEESISFVNTLKIFEISSGIEFLCLIANQGGSQRQPRFVHGVIDPNDLDVVEKNIECKELLNIEKGHKPVELNVDIIQKSFSRESLVIPGLKDQRQLDIAQALHEASGPVIYLDHIDCSISSGIHQTSGPKKGISQFAENIPVHELPTINDIRSSKKTKWVPLYRGRQFNLFEPMVGGFSDQNFKFNQYGLREKLVGQMNFDKDTLVWRRVARSSDQRTLIASSIPRGYWCDENVCTIQFKEDSQLSKLKFLMSGLPVDFCLRNICSANVSVEAMKCLPLTNYSSWFMNEGMITIKEMEERGKNHQGMAKVDALVWLHYGINHPVLNRENLAWLINTQFPVLLRHNPGYADLVLEAYDQYQSLDPNLQPNIFSLK